MFRDYMVQGCLWSGILYAVSYPYIHLFIMQQVNEKMLALNNIITCLGVIIVNSLWNKYSDRLYKFFPWLQLSESVFYLLLHLAVLMNVMDAVAYYIIDTIIFCAITRNLICGGNKLRSVVYKNEAREKYDNTVSIASSLATIIGASVAFVVDIPLSAALILSWMGISVDNVFYFMAYKQSNQNI